MKDTLRLRENTDFKKIYAKGVSLANRYLVLFYMNKEQQYNRVGFIASKKVGKSVVRNRARRLMKESFRIYSSQVKKGYDLIFIARANIKDATYKDVEKAMVHILKKSKLLK
ncbi:ribonuclease P protein component [Crassaminicella thermophila]|uniref:Ribonuclease P protein component n=1 Tax=Crassaminicella thermophila TaxID=2599308 RepID=A0A5C0SJA8_CRATE|nr:ribonuclease P protein component [Crassaminicella thermophila]QEK13534.1 ribonuclease P protein component [Crassaminicella thermophila]